jgi:hypothetical protein
VTIDLAKKLIAHQWCIAYPTKCGGKICERCAHCADDTIASLAAAGFKLVPREPTEPMKAAPRASQFTLDEEVWRCMWDAAP